MRPDAALVIVLGEGDTVLGVSRPDDPADFGLPGGSVEPGELSEVAAIREVLEETGLGSLHLSGQSIPRFPSAQ